MDAYTRVIEALHDSKSFSARSLEAAAQGRDLPAEKENELRKRAVAANDEILKATDVGGFLLSEEALNRLRQYQRDEEEAEAEQDWYLFLERDYDASSRCLTEVIAIAKKDLRTR